MEALTPLEKKRARDIAEEYRSQGYEVIEEPSPGQLPDFLFGYHPDILIRKGDEAIIVEVKSRTSLARSPQIQDLARLLQPRPHWNFELVIVEEEDQFHTVEGTRPLGRDDIQQGIEKSEKLLELGFSEAALLLTWSILEATLRFLSAEEGIALNRLDSFYILKQAAMNGIISRNDYNFLIDVMKYRNALAHGFKKSDTNPSLTQDLIDTTKRLIDPTTSA
jgi:hypothetical protein